MLLKIKILLKQICLLKKIKWDIIYYDLVYLP